MNYVIFSIDNVTDIHTLAKFLRYMDSLRASQQTTGQMVQCIGCSEGKLEVSFIVNEKDFYGIVLPSGYVQNQDSFLIVFNTPTGSTFAYLHYKDGQETSPVRLKEVSKEVALQSSGWTYRPDLDVYWVM